MTGSYDCVHNRNILLASQRNYLDLCITFGHSSSPRMRVMNRNWSAKPRNRAEISHHSVLSGNRIRQCGTSSGSRHKDTDKCLYVASSFCRHRSVPVPCENGSAETTVAEGGRNLVAGLWGRTLGEN